MSRANSSSESEGNRVSFMPDKYNDEADKNQQHHVQAVEPAYLEPIDTPTKKDSQAQYPMAPSQSYNYPPPNPYHQSLEPPLQESSNQGSIEHESSMASAVRSQVNHFVSPAEPIVWYHWCLSVMAICCCCLWGLFSMILLCVGQSSYRDGKRGQAAGYGFISLIFSLVAIAMGTIALIVIIALGVSHYDYLDFFIY